MRSDGDFSSPLDLKLKMLLLLKPDLILDDDLEVSQGLLKAGYNVLQVLGYGATSNDYIPFREREKMNNKFSFVKESANNQTLDETLRILTYEVGDMNKCLHYESHYPKERNAYQPELKKATSQSITMLRMFCEQRGWNFDELATFGEEDYLGKMDDLRKYGLQGI
jgi:hypothetical protein